MNPQERAGDYTQAGQELCKPATSEFSCDKTGTTSVAAPNKQGQNLIQASLPPNHDEI